MRPAADRRRPGAFRSGRGRWARNAAAAALPFLAMRLACPRRLATIGQGAPERAPQPAAPGRAADQGAACQWRPAHAGFAGRRSAAKGRQLPAGVRMAGDRQAQVCSAAGEIPVMALMTPSTCRYLYYMPFGRHAVSQAEITVGEHPCWFDEKDGEMIVHFCPKNRSPHTIFDLNFRTKDPDMHARIKGMFQELSKID